MLAVTAVRMVPAAPFTVVNLAAGASRIPFIDYMLGTVLGMLPGLVLMSALGYQIFNVLTAPTPLNVSVRAGGGRLDRRLAQKPRRW